MMMMAISLPAPCRGTGPDLRRENACSVRDFAGIETHLLCAASPTGDGRTALGGAKPRKLRLRAACGESRSRGCAGARCVTRTRANANLTSVTADGGVHRTESLTPRGYHKVSDASGEAITKPCAE